MTRPVESARCPALSLLRFLLALCLLIAVVPEAAWAQDTQVALNQEGTLYTIDADLRDRLDLFTDVEGFQNATLYRIEDAPDDAAFELVIVYRTGDRRQRERRTLSQKEVATLRQRITRRMQAREARFDRNQDGRNSFLAATTAIGVVEGLSLGAVLVGNGALSENETSLVTALPLAGGALGFFVPLLTTRDSRVSESAAALTGYGGLQGYTHGVQLLLLVGGGDGSVSPQALFALGGALSAAEARLGYVIGNRFSWKAGMGEMVSYTGTLGNLIGLGAGATLLGGDDDVFDDSRSLRPYVASSLLGSLGGIYVGHRLARTGAYTEGDARIYLTSGLLGAQLAGTLLIVSDAEGTRRTSGLLTAGAAGGLGLGALLTGRRRDFSNADGNIAALGAYAGALLGSAIAQTSNAEDGSALLLSSLGSALGFGVSLALFAGDARERAQQASRLDLRIRPTLQNPTLGTAHADPSPPALRPGLNVRVSF